MGIKGAKLLKKMLTLCVLLNFNSTMSSDIKLRVAGVQFDMEWEAVEKNLQHIGELVDRTDADLVVLPEMCATGFSMNSRIIAQNEHGEIVSAIRAMAKSSGKAIIFSAAISEDDKFYNRLFFITPDGEYQTYDKRHLFRMAGENEQYSAGSERLIVQYKGFRICPLVCYDLRFPVFSRGADLYDVLIYIASWPEARSYAWSTLLRARAIENQAYCIGVNRVGSDPKNRYSGNSTILDYLGTPIAEAKDNGEEEVIYGTLSLDNLKEYKEGFAAYLDADKFTINEI